MKLRLPGRVVVQVSAPGKERSIGVPSDEGLLKAIADPIGAAYGLTEKQRRTLEREMGELGERGYRVQIKTGKGAQNSYVDSHVNLVAMEARDTNHHSEPSYTEDQIRAREAEVARLGYNQKVKLSLLPATGTTYRDRKGRTRVYVQPDKI